MKKQSKLVLLAVLFAGVSLSAWGQAPSTEGKDFWVTFLRAADDSPTELKLTISARDSCSVTISNPSTGYTATRKVGNDSSTELVMNKNNCYSSTNEQATYTALHVTATKDISLFAGNYRDKSFDATNVLPTASLLDDYLIQTYPPSDHENKPQGSHFAIVAVEDNTIVDYNLTATTAGNKSGLQTTPTLMQGQVWYVWTGLKAGDVADLSGTTVKARDGKKIAVFQGCPHTNIPYTVRDRDHIVSQAMPTAYWGTEFGITASRHHRRDIVAVMAINDGTQVYINDEQGNKQLVHTFNFNSTDAQEKKHYWTFEIGDSLAYCADNEGQSPTHGKLPYPLVIDSSCYLTTSCPAGVHLFMVSNRYDNVTEKVKSDTLVSDPAMLWVSPIEQVIKEINFSTYSTQQAKFHYMNILTTTSNVASMTWNGQSIRRYFHPLRGNNEYSYARIEIQEGNHNLQGFLGFLAHVYGYGERESYAYSCGSSTVQRSISFNDEPLMLDSVSPRIFCMNEELEMKLNIGNNDYQSVHWDFGDGTSHTSSVDETNKEKKTAHHIYKTPGWYDLMVTATYVNSCTGAQHTEDLGLSFYINRPDTLFRLDTVCLAPDDHNGESTFDTIAYDCDSIVITKNLVLHKADTTFDVEANDQYVYNGSTYTESQVIVDTRKRKDPENRGCDSTITINLTVHKCLNLQVPNDSVNQHTCFGSSIDIPYSYATGGNAGNVRMVRLDDMREFEARMYDDPSQGLQPRTTGTFALSTNEWEPGLYHAKVYVEDLYCGGEAESDVLNIAIYYPSDIFEYRFNNVLAVFKKGFGGNGGTGVYQGADFDMYEWHLVRNEIDAIVGTNNGIYYNGDPFLLDDEVYVRLKETTKPYMLPSCSQIIKDVPDFTPEPQQAPAAQKKLINHRMVIIKDDRTYDMYGQRVQ